MTPILAVILIELHAPGGMLIEINPDQVTALRFTGSQQLLTDEAHCHVSMADGKFIAVVEDCATVRKLMEKK